MKHRFKYLISLLLCIFYCCSAYAQNSDDILWLISLPIDIAPRYVSDEIISKGFNKVKDNPRFFSGTFNNKESIISIHLTQNKIDRLTVSYLYDVDESQVKKEYNDILDQFHNCDYCYEIEKQHPITDYENIADEMLENNKVYEAVFYRFPVFSDEEIRRLQDMDTVDDPNYNAYIFNKTVGSVWFRIFEDKGRFSISIFYDNLTNRPR